MCCITHYSRRRRIRYFTLLVLANEGFQIELMYLCPCFQVGPVKYLSVTIFEDCSPKMLRDFYMVNDYRKQWNKMLIEHEQLHVDKNNGVEVGWTIKKFPPLIAREYILACILWEGKDKRFYCLQGWSFYNCSFCI